MDILDGFQKLVSTDLDWSRLLRPPCLKFCLHFIYADLLLETITPAARWNILGVAFLRTIEQFLSHFVWAKSMRMKFNEKWWKNEKQIFDRQTKKRETKTQTKKSFNILQDFRRAKMKWNETFCSRSFDLKIKRFTSIINTRERDLYDKAYWEQRGVEM
jgi:hypothetical protein